MQGWPFHTVDGWNPVPVEVGSLSHLLSGFIHPRWCRISSINSIAMLRSTLRYFYCTENLKFSHKKTECLGSEISKLPMVKITQIIQLKKQIINGWPSGSAQKSRFCNFLLGKILYDPMGVSKKLLETWGVVVTLIICLSNTWILNPFNLHNPVLGILGDIFNIH